MKHCPHCGGDISAYLAVSTGAAPSAPRSQPPAPAGKYDQTATWKALVERARERINTKSPPTFMELIEPVVATASRFSVGVRPDGIRTIVHIVFDRPIVPRGGVLYQSMMSDGRATHSLEQLKTMGYLVIDGKVVDVDGIPVGPAYGALQYWGGEKQFKRWHLTQPIEIDPSRNGGMFFMDEEMVAFGAKWRDFDKLGESLLSLFDTFRQGVRGDGQIAHPFALEIAFLPA